MRTRSRYRYNVPGKPIASGGIEYGCVSWITTPVGPTLTGMRSAKSAGATFTGRSRARSSGRRSAGGTPVARDGRTVLASSAPLAQLPLQILAIEKPPLLEERALDPADQILDAAFLLRAIRPTHLHADPQVERDAGKRRIPFRDDAVAPPLQRHRLRAIKDGHQGNAAEGDEMIDEGPHERFHALIGHERHFDPPRVLQPRRKEMHLGLGPVLIPDDDFAKVVLRKLGREALEPHQRRDRARARSVCTNTYSALLPPV